MSPGEDSMPRDEQEMWQKWRRAFWSETNLGWQLLPAASYCTLGGGLLLTLLPSGLLKGLKETSIKCLALSRDSIKDIC